MAAIFDPARISVIEASTKAGKTAGCICWQAKHVLEDTRCGNHWWVAPVYKQAEMAYDRAKKYFPRDEYAAHDGDLKIEFRNGARWWFRSGEKPDNLYGEDVYSVVVDEATRVREEAWYAIRSVLTYTRGPVRIIGNVKGRKNWAYRLGQLARNGEPDMAYHKLTAADAVAAGVLDQAEIEGAKRVLPEAVFRELYFAEPSDDEGNPFGIGAIRRVVKPLSNLGTCVYGIDLAKSCDWTVVCGLDADGNVSRMERWQGEWHATKTRILGLIGAMPTLIDSTGVGDPIVEELSRLRPNIKGFKFTSQSKQQLMEGLAVAIQSGSTSVLEGFHRDELESFEYEYTRTGARYSAPDGLHDDSVCAHALAVECARSNRPSDLLFGVTSLGSRVPQMNGWANE